MRAPRAVATQALRALTRSASSTASAAAEAAAAAAQRRSRHRRDRAPLFVGSRNEWWGKDAGSAAPTRLAPAQGSSYKEKREAAGEALQTLPEMRMLEQFHTQLRDNTLNTSDISSPHLGPDAAPDMTREQALAAVEAGILTFVSHAEARVASSLGEAFYTIGPCGEELLAVVGQLLEPTDAMALHYRHLATQVARHLPLKGAEQVMLDRARAHTISSRDAVTGGVHCSLGGDDYSFLVTSTLASQTCPAVGRALARGLTYQLKVPSRFPDNFVSYVSMGDGSVNNAHFLAGANLAAYAKFRAFKCPLVMAISDNDLCISLRGYGWLRDAFAHKLGMPVHVADGSNLFDVWAKSRTAIETARATAQPHVLLFTNLPRRFGHAATDRQDAYLHPDEVEAQVQRNPLAGACQQVIQAGWITHTELADMLERYRAMAIEQFNVAASEPKVDEENAMERLFAAPLDEPRTATRTDTATTTGATETTVTQPARVAPVRRRLVMRKAMTNVIDELMTENENMVYMGEDVEHGGYYLVTEGLKARFPLRVRDFPPDETSLLGVGIGYAQAGLLPVVEIPYAKYLDCGADMFFEACMASWLSNRKQPNGMIIRLQGFGAGVFGGNFHTHNMLHLPPGLDVVCYSNGEDYVRGWRYALRQARRGRVVMSVDSTALLNHKHIHGDDDAWRAPYPAAGEEMGFHDVRVRRQGSGEVLIVTYGSGVLSSLVAAETLAREDGISTTVVDAPYLSAVPHGLLPLLESHGAAVFVDVCKQGQQPLGGHITQLHSEGRLPAAWASTASLPTYNPLGSLITFVDDVDVVEATRRALKTSPKTQL